ncbi:DUF1365 domain-containing protein [Nocardiopsis suaedae]|uniref:DUF1365 domain-containing protein n=1 Tax=Nocardiopsis suaedae TaxID=3018444 RepID=A0ABT4TVC3_9ACTN|nr:DUF1365 domain-containing protein [Nocardiopsis suaedae]MDA2808635.1 DUF1365 domain-containing protein [Nocardiopsis suaedae]
MSGPTTPTTVPALYEATVRHTRTAPLHHAFAYRGYYWLVDLDAVPRLPAPLRPLARFHARDHCGDPSGTLRGNVDAYLAEHGIDLQGGRVLMLAHARVLGYVFNPLTVYWCHGADGTPVCAVAEVHNTYRQRHRYLLRTDRHGRARADKTFPVSPFNPVDGHYRISVPEPDRALRLAVTLVRSGRTVFAASLRGERRPTTPRTLLGLALRHPLTPLIGALRIRLQGIWLLLRGLPIVRGTTADGPASARRGAAHPPADPPTEQTDHTEQTEQAVEQR